MRLNLLLLLTALASASADTYGVIKNFGQSKNSVDSITLEWDFEPGDVAISKYTLVTDDDFSQDIRCPVAHCVHVVDYLDSCTIYKFTLTPYFKDHKAGKTVSVNGNTVEEVPSAPVTPSATSSSKGIFVTWKPPKQSSNCVDKYVVCARIKGEVDAQCQESKDLTLLLPNIELCSNYVISITPATPMGQFGPASSTETRTEEGVPGAPENVVVMLSTPTMISITYDDPLTNPHCVDEFGVMYGEVTDFVPRVGSSNVNGKHEHTISPLDACTNYTIGVYGINPSGIIGPTNIHYAATADLEPAPAPAVIVNPTGSNTIDVIWPGDPTNKCADNIDICWTDHIHPEEICEGIDDKDTIDGGGTFTITDLLPCSSYEVTITVNSPTGLSSLPLSNWSFTNDIVPGPVENLAVEEASVSSVMITYSPPSEQRQCVKEYDTRVINLDEGGWRSSEGNANNGLRIAENFNQLDACTNYAFHVRAVTRSGLVSDWKIVETKTAEAKPSEPRNLQVKSFTDTSISVIWFQPETNKMCVAAYRLTWSDGTKSGSETIDLSKITPAPFEVERRIKDLDPCTEYTFIVKSVSSSLGEIESKPLKAKTGCTY